MSETRKYRKFTPQQKLELVMASWRGERSIAELRREHEISESLLRRWRGQALEVGSSASRRVSGASTAPSSAGRSPSSSGRLGRKTYELEIAGRLLRDWE